MIAVMELQGWIQRLSRWQTRRSRYGNADRLPARLRRDMGLAAPMPLLDYREPMSSGTW